MNQHPGPVVARALQGVPGRLCLPKSHGESTAALVSHRVSRQKRYGAAQARSDAVADDKVRQSEIDIDIYEEV